MSLNYIYEQFENENKEDCDLSYFDSINDVINTVEDGYTNLNWKNQGHENGLRYDNKIDRWTWGEVYYENLVKTKTMLRNGDISDIHFSKIKNMLEEIQRTPEYRERTLFTRKLRRTVYKEEGDELSIDRLMSGNPEHWSKVEKSNEKPLYKICINGSLNSCSNKDEFLNIAAVAYIISTIKNLENKSTEIDLMFKTKDGSDKLDYSYIIIKLKHANESIDMKKICVPVIQGVHRGYHFAIKTNIYRGTPSLGLGSSASYNNELESYKYDCIINGKDIGDDVVEYVTNLLKKKDL